MKQDKKQSPGEAAAVGLALLAWLIPGAGHYCLGHRYRGAFFCIVVCGMLLLGLVFGEYTVISYENHHLALILQVFAGLPTLLTVAVPYFDGGFQQHIREASAYIDLGMALTLIAGALNILLIADVYYRAVGEEVVSE